MLIGIDGNEANMSIRVGVGQYSYNILINLYKLDTKNKYIVYLKSNPLPDMPPERENWEYRVFGPQKMWTRLALPLFLYLQKEKLDLFFSTSHYSPRFSPFPTIPTIHDLGYLKYQQQFTKKDLYQLINWTKQAIDRSEKIVAVSEFTKNTIVETYKVDPNKIFIAANGVTKPEGITKEVIGDTLEKFNIDKPYYLYLGTLKPSKNIPFLVRSFAKYLKSSKSDEFLVIAGKKGWLFDDIFETVKQEDIVDRVIFTDYISQEEKWALFSAARATVIPSVYEGFGIPAIESMLMGTPVIVSKIPPFLEVVGESGLYIDPYNEKDLVAKMLEVSKKSVRDKLVRGGYGVVEKYSWENAARSLISVFEKQ